MARYWTAARSAAGEPARATVLVRPGQWQSEMRITVTNQNGAPLARHVVSAEAVGRALSPDQALIVVVGPPIGIDAANALAERSANLAAGRRRIEVAAYDTIAQLPHDPRGLDGVDWVVLSTSRFESSGDAEPNAPAARALERWVERGGRLVVSAAGRAKAVTDAGSELSWTAPGKLTGMAQLKQLGPLEGYIQSTDTPEPSIDAGLEVATFDNVTGIVEASDGGQPKSVPLVIRRAFGFGQIVFLPFDLDSPALARWPGRPQLINRLLLRRPHAPESETPARTVGGSRSEKAYVDLAEQLRDAVDQFPSIGRVPVGALLASLAAFLAVVGPIDYYFVRRRPQWAWLTFAVSVALFLACALWWTNELRPQTPRISQIEVVDVAFSDGRHSNSARSSVWTNVYSPRADSMSLRYSPNPAGIDASPRTVVDQREFLAISAPPTSGRDFQGASALPFTHIYSNPYEIDDRTGSLRDVSFPAGATRAAFVEWEYPAPDAAPSPLTLDHLGRPSGHFIQPLGVPLDDCVLYAGTSAYRLGRLAAGARVTIGNTPEQHSAVAVLTRRRMIEDRHTAAPYDAASLDAARILEIILLYELAGGEGYTRLRNDVHARLDLSGHLALDRAILVGTSQTPAGTLSLSADRGDDATPIVETSLTVYRFVIPLKRAN
jgi:hypothetical protein